MPATYQLCKNDVGRGEQRAMKTKEEGRRADAEP